MKTLIVYYSKTGNTKKIATELAGWLKADLDEIKDSKKLGMLGVMIACRNAMRHKKLNIIFSKNPQDYDLVVLGGPVWAWNLIPQLRSYLEENQNKIKKLGFFVTYGGNYGKNFVQVEEFKKPIATMAVVDKEIKANNYTKEINEFINKINKE
ncbi:MAG: flavodoxin [Candidatus Komeilibacteria bacterium]